MLASLRDRARKRRDRAEFLRILQDADHRVRADLLITDQRQR